MPHEIVESETIYLRTTHPFWLRQLLSLATKTKLPTAADAKRFKSGPVVVAFDSRKNLGTLDWIHEDKLILHPPAHSMGQRPNLPKSK